MKWIGMLAACLLLVGCGGTEADIPLIETQIGNGILEQTGYDVEVDCPDTIDWKAGGSFGCFATDETGDQVRVTVYMENDEGDITWAVE